MHKTKESKFMEEWKEYKLGEVVIPVKDRIETSFLDTSSYVSTENMLPSKAGITLSSGVPSGNAIKYEKEDILISNIRPYFKKIWRADRNGGCSADVICLRASNSIDPLFLYYLLSQDLFFDYVMQGAKGTKMPRGDRNQIMQWTVSLPSKSEQRKIASVLSALDDKIEVNRRINDNFYFAFLEVMLIWLLTSLRNDNLEQQAQALFKSWFVDFEPFRDQSFVESELGMIPQGWRIGTIGELLEIKYGKDHKKLSDGEIPVYGSGGLMRKCECALYNGESVLIPRKGTLNNVMYVNEAFWTVDTMFYSIPKIDNVVLFTYLYLRGKDLASMNSGSAVPSMTTEILNNMQIVIPTEMVIQDFNIKVTSIYSRIKHGDNESRCLSQLRDTLLPRLMSGEIKVGDVTL